MPPPAKPQPLAPLPMLSVVQLLDVERWARQGLNAQTIATLLGMTPQQFEAMARHDSRIYECMEHGRATGIRDVSHAMLKSARSGSDSGAARFYLERIGGANWMPQRALSPTVTVFVSAPDPEAEAAQVARINAGFARQRKLIDGSAEELRDDTGVPPEKTKDQ